MFKQEKVSILQGEEEATVNNFPQAMVAQQSAVAHNMGKRAGRPGNS